MRRLQLQEFYNFNGGGGGKSAAADGHSRSRSDEKGKSKIWEEQDAGDEETMAEIQHLEETFENQDESSDNPSNLSTWTETMMINQNPPIQPPLIDASAMKTVTPNTNVLVTTAPTADPTSAFMPMDDLVLLHNHAIQPPRKKQKPSSASASASHHLNPVVLWQIKFNGVSLIHTLMASARAVGEENFLLAEILLKQAGSLAVSQSGPMTKVASYFSDALARRIYPNHLTNPQESPVDNDRLVMHFYEACPYLKFAHFTANQALLEAFVGKKKVHVIDFSMNQGYQWPALLQALAVRPGGPPSFRLTGIGEPSAGKITHLQESGAKLSQLADAIHVKFEYRPLVVESLADIESVMLDLRDDEVVAVNSIFEFHKLLGKPGSVEKLLSAVKDMKPAIVTMVEQEANHNGVDFVERFNESLLYYGTMFDSLESSCNREAEGGARFPAVVRENKAMSEIFLGKQICNVVACEGEERVERHETLTQWKTRLDLEGFRASRLGSFAFRQATMFIEILAGGAGYIVVESDGCLMLGWHTRPLITTSAWKLRSGQVNSIESTQLLQHV